jgi:hypothetical protein
MDCKKTQRYLSEYIDAVLDEPARMAVEIHLSQCSDCRAELASLKAVVEELKSIQPIMAPDNFLADLHTRMEQTSPLKKLLQMMFVPFRIKIPLELATATVLAVFIFFIVQAPDIKKEWDLAAQRAEHSKVEKTAPTDSGVEEISRPAPESKEIPAQPDREQIASRASKMASPPAIPSKAKKERPSTAEPALSRTPQLRATAKKSSSLELVLFIQPPTINETLPELSGKRSKVHIQKSKSETYSAGKRLKAPLEQENRVVAPAPATETAPRGQGAAGVVGESQPMDEPLESASSPTHVISGVKKIVRRLQGKVLSVQHEKQTQKPQFIIMEIPARHYHTLLNYLEAVGTLRTPRPKITVKRTETVRIRIRLMPL